MRVKLIFSGTGLLPAPESLVLVTMQTAANAGAVQTAKSRAKREAKAGDQFRCSPPR
jgi:hypothetical protein